MTDYESIDLSVEDGSPIHLVQFLYDGTYYRYTPNYGGVLNAVGYNWDYANIAIGDIISTSDIHKNNIDIEMTIDHSFSQIFILNRQESITGLTIYRGYEKNPANDWNTVWKGRVSGYDIRGNKIVFVCESIFTSMKRPGIRGKMSKHCRHVHYGRGCNLDPDDPLNYTEDIVSDISADGLTLTIDAAALQSDGFYRAGMVRAGDGIYRFIRSHNGDQITISNPHVGFISSDTVRLLRGCDRTIDVCDEQGNLENHGGFPYTPDVNPLGGTRLQ